MIEKAKLVVTRNKRLLIVYNGQDYSLPGGKIGTIYGESATHAVRRETMEETHGHVTGIRLYDTMRYHNGNNEDVCTRVYRGRISGRLAHGWEIKKVLWASREELDQKYMPNSKSLKKTKAKLIKGGLI